MPQIDIVQSDHLPICPHCNKQLERVEKIEKGFIEQHVVYICPHCHKILSIGYNYGH